MLIVSDTGPINYLVQIGCIDVLGPLFGAVLVPPGVVEELRHIRTPHAVRAWIESPPPWAQRKSPSTVDLTIGLGQGESEAIALAVEVAADGVLMDDLKGKRVAKQRGLRVIGTLAVLKLAAELSLIDLLVALDALEATSFHAPAELIVELREQEALRRSR